VPDVAEWVTPAAFVAGGGVVGLVAEGVVLARLRRYTAARRWAGRDLVLTSLRGIVFVWCLVAGLDGAILSVSLRLSVLASLQKVLLVVVIISVTLAAARITAGSVGLYSQRLYQRSGGASLPSPTIVTNFTQLLVVLVGLLILLDSLGIRITPILTALGVGGLAVALALQDTLSNLFAGLYIITSRQIKPGDYIKLNTSEEGYVLDITWRNTKIKDGPNNMIIVPNAKLASATVTNYHEPDREVAVPVPVHVGYESDFNTVDRVTLAVAREVLRDVPGGVATFEPVIRYHAFGDTSINFTVVLRAKDIADQVRLKHEFITRLVRCYQQEGITLASIPMARPEIDGAVRQRT
jgi:small-conductance mechanosensitive channel